MMKDTIGKMPESDQKELNDVKNTVGGVAGGALQNPLGDMVSLEPMQKDVVRIIGLTEL